MTRNDPWLLKVSESFSIALLVILSIFFQLLTEWLFFITKPSFLDNLSLPRSFLVLLAAPLIPCFVSLAIISMTILAEALSKGFKMRRFWQTVRRFIPAFFLTTSIFLMLDNFTNVIFHFGLRSSHGWSTCAYTLIFVALGILIFHRVSILDKKWKYKSKSVFAFFTASLIAFIVPTAILHQPLKAIALSDVPMDQSSARPNILLFGGDSIEATSMSAYSYQKDTTPFIREFIKTGLLCENAFANASQTAGSLTSLLTSKLPTQTRVLHEPDFLRDIDSYEHLPGLLRKKGYQSAQFSMRIYGDAYDLNLKSSFDFANFRSIREQTVLNKLGEIAGQETMYFLRQTYRRISERLMHIFYIRKMTEPFSIVTDSAVTWASDQDNMNGLLSFISSSKKPFFAHIHLLAPHVETPEVLTNAINNLYESRIRNVDTNFRRVIDLLERSNQVNKTLIIFYSDHARRGDITKRVPLLFWFPDAKYSGRISENVTLLDVAPTILDYMGLQIPEWMEGRSILSEEPKRCRRIFAGSAGPWDQNFSYVISRPPFFSLWKLTAIVCDRYYMFDLLKNKFIKEGLITGHTGECGRCSRRTSKANIHEFIVEHLSQNGYDTSSIDTNRALRVKQ